MALIRLTRANVAHLKRCLIDQIPGLRSGHAHEAIAFGIGFITHAAVLAALRAQAAANVTVQLCEDRLLSRLQALGYRVASNDVMAAFARADLPDGDQPSREVAVGEIQAALRQSIEALPENNQASQRALYKTARATLAGQLRDSIH